MNEPRWTPDEQLVAAVLAGSCARRMSDLSEADRAWVVAGLTVAGCTAEDIAERLGCSLRLVRTIRSWPMTRVCTYAQTETAAFSGELRLRNSALASLRHELAAAHEQMAALRRQRDNLIDAAAAHTVLCGVCGEPLCGYNLYEHRGKRYCRTCGRRRAKQARDRAREARRCGAVTGADGPRVDSPVTADTLVTSVV